MGKIDDILAKYETEEPEEKPLGTIDRILAKYETEDTPEVITEPVTQERQLEPDSNVFEQEGTLKKVDLKTGNNANTIRKYMLDRFGQDYRFDGKIDDDAMVEDFFNHMRSFNTNLVSTAGEVRFVSKADDQMKVNANRAFELYDRTGSVFTNDGVFGAIDGVADYMKAAALDPTNYLGLLTGGLFKGAAVTTAQGAKMSVKAALKEAARVAMKDQATVQASKKAAGQARTNVLKHMATNSVSGKKASELAYDIAKKEAILFRKEMVRKAQREALADARKQQGRKAIMATTAIDGTLAALNDYQIQSVYSEVDPNYQYSIGQTAFSSLFGTVAGGAQLAGGAFKGASGLADAGDAARIAAKREQNVARADTLIAREGKILTDKQLAQAKEKVKSSVTSWAEKVKNKKNIFDDTVNMPLELLKDIVLGAERDGKGDSLVSLFNEAVKEGSISGINKNHRVSDILTNVVKNMEPADIADINKALSPFHITLGDISSQADTLRDLMAGGASDAGKTLNVWSQAQRLINGSLLRTDDVASTIAEGVIDREADKAKRMKGLQYGQNLWRRMLVSSVSTTAVNVAGFAQYYVASSLADILSGGMLMIGSVVTPGAKGVEMRRVGKIYMNTVAQKARHLLDPFTTHDEYMRFLSQNKDVSKTLFETVSGGVERTAQRYGIDDTKAWYQVAERVANGASNLTGVRIQDSFTKSQMFMTEMDKYMRIKHNTTFADALKNNKLDLIDNDVIGSALDVTMKSVYSKDYTTDDQLLGAVAKQVESFSNLPLIGTILPFGRFMNNTVATAYQLGPLSFIPAAARLARNQDTGSLEAMSRSMIGTSALVMAMQYDEQNAAEERPYHVVDSGGGTLVDVKNMFPMSLFLAVGRMANLERKGEFVPPEIKKDVLAQLAVGQFASDVQFGNDLYNVFDVFTSTDEDKRGLALEALYQKTGSILAGFTRPLDAVNKMVGYVNNTDAARDPRQATGTTRMGLEASKYLDNIVEMFNDKLDSVTGEELRVALRAGSVYDHNPLASIFGVKVVPSRTSGEILYSVAEMHPYMANQRTNVPAYDKLYNTMIQPILDKQANKLLNDPNFKKKSKEDQRIAVNTMIKDIKKDLNDQIEMYGSTKGSAAEKLRAKLYNFGSKEEKYKAKQYMKEKGVEGPMTDWTWNQLRMYEEFITFDREYR